MTELVITSVVVEIGAPASFGRTVPVDHGHYPQWNRFTGKHAVVVDTSDPWGRAEFGAVAYAL